MEILSFVVIATVAVVAIVYSVYRNKEFQNQLEDVASRLHLNISKPSRFEAPELNGSIEGHGISIFKKVFGHGKSSTSTLAFEVNLLDAGLSSFSISAEGFVSGVNRLFGDDDIQTGDVGFDKKILLDSSSPSRLLALLPIAARCQIQECMDLSYSHNFNITNERIKQYIKLDELDSSDDIIRHLNKVLALASVFKRKGSLTELLADNYRVEPIPQCRKVFLNALCALSASFVQGDPLITQALNEGDEEISFCAAKLLGKAGSNLMKELYAQGSDHFKTQILAYCCSKKEAGFLDFLLQQAKRENAAVLAEMAKYFAAVKSNKAEPTLLTELETSLAGKDPSRDRHYSLLMIEALAACGTIKSIEPLYNIKSLSLKRDAEKAIAAIQARIGTGESGWLSIPESPDSSGRLSMTDDETSTEQ